MDEELKLAIKAYDEFRSVFGQFSTALEGVERAEKAVATSTDAVNRTVQVFMDTMQKTGPPLQRRKKATDDVADADKKAAGAAHQHGKAADDLAHSQDKAGKAAHGHKDALDDLIMGLGMLGITAAVARGFSEVTEAGAAFNRELAILKGMTGQAVDTSEQFLENLNVERKGMTELAQGMNELARAGYDASDAMTALPDIAEFSKASFKSVSEAGAPVLQILKTFQKDVRDTGEVADVLTTAANKSALGFDDFQLGLAMSAGVARIAGQSYQELVAELSVLRDAGLGASDAGTSIKSAWLALMNPTTEAQQVMKDLGISVYDAQGKMKSWADIVGSVEKAVKPLNEQSRNLALTTIFGSDGVRAMALSMGRGSEYIRAMTEDLKTSQGATAELAYEMGQTFTGATERAQANLERLKITLFQDIEGGLTGLLGALDTLVVGFNSLEGGGRRLLEILVGGTGLVVGMASLVAFTTKVVAPMLTGITTAFTTAATAAGGLSTAMAAVGGPVGVAVLAVSALVLGVTAYAGAQERARLEEERKARSLLDLSARYDDLQQAMNDTSRSEAEHQQAGEELKRTMNQIGQQFPELVKRWDDHGNAVLLDTERLRENTKAANENARAQAAAALAKAKQTVDNLQKDKEAIENQIKAAQAASADRGFWSQMNAAQAMVPAGGSMMISPKLPDNVAELQGKLATVNREIDKAVSEWTKYYTMVFGEGDTYYGTPTGSSATPSTGGTKTYNPDAEDAAAKAEKERVAAIRDQMDLLRHLITMDDERVDTAQEQLDWLLKIRSTLGTTRDLDEAIHKIEGEISRQPLQDQLAAFEKRKQLGEVTARQEQQFYEELLANAEKYKLTQQEIGEYQVQAALAKKAADKELADQSLAAVRYNIDMQDASTANQIEALKAVRDMYADGSAERKSLDLEIHQLEKQLAQELHDQKLAEIEFDSVTQRWTNAQKLQALKDYLASAKDLTIEEQRSLQQEIAQMEQRLQEETHQAALAEIEFDAITQRWTNDKKLQALKDYLATAHDLTIAQQRELQQGIAQMEQQAERDHQQTLLDLFRGGLETQRRYQEKKLRDQQESEEKAKQKAIDDTRAHYEGLIGPLQQQLDTMQAQTKELERQNRLLELQKSLQEKDQEIADAKAIRNRVVIEAGGPLGFSIRRTYDEVKVRELEKDRAQIVDDIRKEQDRQARERAEEALQDQISRLQKERDAKLKTLQDELQDMRTKHGEELEALNTYWQDRLSTQSLKQALELTGWKDHYGDVLAETQTWVADMNKAISTLQQPTFQTGADLAKSLGGSLTSPPGSATSGAGGSGTYQGVKEPVTIENNFYGDNHFNGLTGLQDAARALADGARESMSGKR